MRRPLWPAGLGLLAAVLAVTAPAATAGASTQAAHTTPHRLPGQDSYSIVNRYSGRCIDKPGGNVDPGIQLQQYSCNETEAQRWTFYPLPGGDWNIMSFSPIYEWLCLQDQGGWVGNGVPALQWYCAWGQDASENWRLVPVPGLYETYYIESDVNPRCLGVDPNWGVNDGDKLAVLNCDLGADQQWVLQDRGYKHQAVTKPPQRRQPAGRPGQGGQGMPHTAR